MANYSVTKNFGRFKQCWEVKAESEQEAWNKAETGSLIFQSAYRERCDLDSSGYVVNSDLKKENEPVTSEEYNEWLREAIDLGMYATPREHELAYGLPFHIIRRD